jgi:hypothetical protein
MPEALRGGDTTEKRLGVTPYRAVAVGSKARMTVRDEWRLGLHAPLTLTAVESGDPAVVTASSDGATLVLDAHKAGEAMVTLAASVGDANTADTLRVWVVEPSALRVARCDEEHDGAPVYAAGELAVIPFELRATAPFLGTRAWGAGRYPVAIKPSGAASVDLEASDADTLVLRIAPDAPSHIKLTSTLPNDPLSFDMEIVPLSAAHKLDVQYASGASVTRGEKTRALVIYKTEQGRAICSRLPYRVKKSSSLCRFEPEVALSQANDLYGAAAGIMVEGVVTGACQLVLEAMIEGVEIAVVAAIEIAVVAPAGGHDWD